MSYCREEGKDRVVFLTKEDLSEPSSVVLPASSGDEIEGPILPNGEINWNCPCMSSTVSGPCGVEFREAFSCYHHSQTEPKGEDCGDSMRGWYDCMLKHSEDEIDGEEPDNSSDGISNAMEATSEAVQATEVKVS